MTMTADPVVSAPADDDTDDAPAPKPPMTEDQKFAEAAEWYEKNISAEQREANAKTVFEGEFRLVAAKNIKVDRGYQRRINPTKLRKLLKNFDPTAFEPITVSERADGSLWSPEGQHRTILAQIVNEDMLIPCYVHKGLTVQTEAHQTGTIHRGRTSFSSLDLFRTDLAAGEAEAVAVNRIVTEAGLTIGGAKGILAVKALRKIHERSGDAGLAIVLRVIDQAWTVAYPEDAWGYSVMAGVGEFVVSYTDDEGNATYNEANLIRTLRNVSPESLIMTANDPKQQQHYTSKPKIISGLISRYYNREAKAARATGEEVSNLKV